MFWLLFDIEMTKYFTLDQQWDRGDKSRKSWSGLSRKGASGISLDEGSRQCPSDWPWLHPLRTIIKQVVDARRLVTITKEKGDWEITKTTSRNETRVKREERRHQGAWVSTPSKGFYAYTIGHHLQLWSPCRQKFILNLIIFIS